MEDRQEIGGAQALLLLGTKDSKNDEHVDNNNHTNNNSGDQHVLNGENAPLHEDTETLEEKENQQLNDAVEAAVMRYVGGTLESEQQLHATDADDTHGARAGVTDLEDAGAANPGALAAKRRLHHDEIMSNIADYQWDRFLEADVAADLERTPPRKRARKNSSPSHEIDPELAGLDSEHDQLVHAAILGAGELAKQLAEPDEKRAGPDDDGEGPDRVSEHNLPRNVADNTEHIEEPTPDTDTASTAITQLAHAASALLGGLRPSAKHRRPLRKASELQDIRTVSQAKYDHLSLSMLVEQAASEALTWYSTHGDTGMGPRPFSRDEIQIMDNFVDGYCRLHHVSRLDVCQRVWSNERTKDDFWQSMTKVFPYRLRASVYKHVRRQYHVFDIRAKWTPQEDAMLRKLAATCSTNWKKIGEVMQRMPEDCRDRWRNYVKCGDNRASNKWTESEEHTLQAVVLSMLKDKPQSINWTLVSERMDGTRLRIQCRYKWNKLVRRERAARVSRMDASTRLWLCNRILEADVSDAASVDWEYLAHVYHAEHKKVWLADDLKAAFSLMISQVRDRSSLPLSAIVAKAMAVVYDEVKEEKMRMEARMTSGMATAMATEMGELPMEKPEEKDMANAAVAAVVPEGQETLLYGLWR